jgi:DNA-directed RNA polymerase subunit K/omega
VLEKLQRGRNRVGVFGFRVLALCVQESIIVYTSVSRVHAGMVDIPHQDALTRYEKASVIGMRMEQLQRGANPMVDVSGMESVREIALAELAQGRLPFVVTRRLPNGGTFNLRLGTGVAQDTEVGKEVGKGS